MNWWQRLTPLAMAILLLGAAAAEVGGTSTDDGRAGAAMLWGVGFVFLGAWLALEIRYWREHPPAHSETAVPEKDDEDEGTT